MQKTAKKIEEAADSGAQIVCLQELYRSQYFPQQENQDVRMLAESIPGQSTRLFGELAKKRNIVIVVPIFEKADSGKFFNTAAVIGSDGKVMGKYRKIHIPQNPNFYEKNYFSEGDGAIKCSKRGLPELVY